MQIPPFNPQGYIPPDAEIEEERKKYRRPLGVSYLVGWMIVFLLLMLGMVLLSVFLHG